MDVESVAEPVSSPVRPETTVLVVDDDPGVVDSLVASLKFHGFAVHAAATGAAAFEVARIVRPDVVVCEVGLAGMDDFGVLRRMRAEGIDAPVLFLTARTALRDRITGLTVGGDDYVTKPFSLEEVATRLHVILRRTRPGLGESQARLVRFADLELDEDTHEVRKAGQPVALSPTEFKLLHFFMINANRALSKPLILDHVWPYDFSGGVNVVESYVSYLRRKIDTGDMPLLHTLRGVGYVLRTPR